MRTPIFAITIIGTVAVFSAPALAAPACPQNQVRAQNGNCVPQQNRNVVFPGMAPFGGSGGSGGAGGSSFTGGGGGGGGGNVSGTETSSNKVGIRTIRPKGNTTKSNTTSFN